MTRDNLQESLFVYWGKSTISSVLTFLVICIFLFVPVAIWLNLAASSSLVIRILVGIAVVWGLAIGLAVAVGGALVGASLFNGYIERRGFARDRERLNALVGDAPTLPTDAWADDEDDG